jgi:hypothetical protein
MKNIYPPGTDHKPYSNNFDNTSMYDVQEKIQIHLHTEKFNNNIRPKATPIYKQVPTPNKDLSFYHPGQEVIRNDINKYKNIYRIKITSLFMYLHIIIFKKQDSVT